MPTLKSKAQGCLFGQAIGDALGARYEFSSKAVAGSKIRTDKGTNLILPIIGGGPHNVVPGQVTDDTEMALALARSLQRKGSVDICDIAASYVTWYRSDPPDIGHTTTAAFFSVRGGLADAKSAYDSVIQSALAQNKPSLSNACLMRISPLAIAAANWNDDNRLRQVAHLDTQMTNPNPITCDAVRVYVTALRALIRSEETDFSAAELAYQQALSVAKTTEIREHLLAAARPNLFPVKLPDGQQMMTADSTRYMGYMGLALQIAFYELLHAETFVASLERVVGLGGDTDTNGCIAGALLGARFGEEGIPDEWKVAIISADIEKRLTRYPWASLSDLVELVDGLLKCVEPTTITSRVPR